MRSKKMPINKPFLSAYKHHGIPLSLMALFEESLPWIFSNFIQLYIHDFMKDPHWLDFYLFEELLERNGNPCFTVNTIDRTIISNITSPIEFIINSIDLNKYVAIEGDQFFHPHSKHFNKKHRYTNFLIFGYDRENNVFDIMDYWQTKNYKYEILKLDFLSFERSFLSELNRIPRIWLLHIHEFVNFPFDIKLVSQLIQDYITGQNHAEKFTMLDKGYNQISAYGINVYSFISKYVQMLMIDSNLATSQLPFSILLEHKKSMLALLNHLLSSNQYKITRPMVEQYSVLEKETLILHNLFLKYIVLKNTTVANKILFMLDEIPRKEIDILSKVLIAIKGQ